MKPRYSKRVREEAALICAIAASSNEPMPYAIVQSELELSSDSYLLSCSAYGAVTAVRGSPARIAEYVTCDAEAHALLEDGWSPGDPL